MRIPLRNLGQYGVIHDQEGYELALNAFTDVQNMRMYAGWAERVKGHLQVFEETMIVPTYVTQYGTTTTKYIVHAGPAGIYADDGAARYDITNASYPPTLAATDRFSGGTFGGVLVLNSPTDKPVYWNGNTATDVATITDWPVNDLCKAMCIFGYYLVALNITRSGTNYPYRVKWSTSAEPGSLPNWTSLASNDAGEVDRPATSPLVDGMTLGNSLILYFEESMQAMAPDGSLAVMGFTNLDDKVGMLATGCGVSIPGIGHVVLGKGGNLYRHSGNGVTPLLDGVNRQWLHDNIDPNFFSKTYLQANMDRSEVWVCFPEVGSQYCTQALIWNWATGEVTCGQRDLPNTTYGCVGSPNFAIETIGTDTLLINEENVILIGDGPEAFSQNDSRMFMASGNGKIYAVDGGTTFDGSDFTAYVERTGLNDIADLRDRVKHLKRIWLSVDAAVGTVLTINFGASNDADTAPTYTGEVTYTVGTSRWVDSWATGVFLAYKISATGSAAFRIRSIDPEVVDAGQY